MYDITVNGDALPTTIIPITDEPVTFVTLEYGGRTFRFCIRGEGDELEVSYRHEFPTWDDETGREHHAWFPISEGEAVRGVLIQQYVFPQLLEIHRAAHAVERNVRSA